MEQDNRAKWVADDVYVLLPNRSGGFSLFGCPTPELHVRRIVASVNALSHLSLEELESFAHQEKCVSMTYVDDQQVCLRIAQRKNDELLVAMEKLREAFVMASGDKSPFAKCALQMAADAIAKAKCR
ncbi:hypothetical protein K8D10_08405 [Aeromonas veronii]|uniref:hypothetical protein n=1 Tax=Aeromonas veronii TaxID=654 RepID=UPI00207C182A|nr:hypothetical protein [Aeromonas veronii]MCO4171805.1 hypothetical protein [Aeromonas veronii]